MDGAHALYRALRVVVAAVDGPHTNRLLVKPHHGHKVDPDSPNNASALAKFGLVQRELRRDTLPAQMLHVVPAPHTRRKGCQAAESRLLVDYLQACQVPGCRANLRPISGTQRHSAALSGTQRHSAALSGTQRHYALRAHQRVAMPLDGPSQTPIQAERAPSRHTRAASGWPPSRSP
jgi:hypothetical protein